MTTDEIAQCHAVAAAALNADNAIKPDESASFVVPHLAVIDGTVRVIDATGQPRRRPNKTGTGGEDYMTVDELLAELRYYNPRFRYRHNDA